MLNQRLAADEPAARTRRGAMPELWRQIIGIAHQQGLGRRRFQLQQTRPILAFRIQQLHLGRTQLVGLAGTQHHGPQVGIAHRGFGALDGQAIANRQINQVV